MKFEKINDRSSSTVLTAEQIAASNRWEERESKRKAQQFAAPPSAYTRAKISRLFRELADSIGSGPEDPWRARRPMGMRGKDARQSPAYREAAEEHLSELLDRYADSEPLRVSEEALSLITR